MSKSLKKSNENIMKSDDEESPFQAANRINYKQFMSPKSDRVFEFKSKRIEFRRRPSFEKM